MKKKRGAARITSSEKCELVLHGSRHECLLKNISPAGALVTCTGFLRETWPDDEGVLHFNAENSDRACKVTHISAQLVGLRFIDKK